MKRRSADLILAMLLLQVLAVFSSAASAAPATSPASRPGVPQTQSAPLVGPNQNLLAHGTDEYFWVARVQPAPDQNPPGEVTQISFHTAGAEGWQHLADLPVRVIGLANYGTQLAVLREGGEWSLLSDNGAGSTGVRLPDNARMLALANDSTTLWAIGLVQSAPATQPATNPASTRPGIGPISMIAPHLALFMLVEGDWKPANGAPLPLSLPVDAAISLAVIDRIPHLAIRRDDSTIEVLRPGKSSWKAVARFPAPLAPAAFKIIPGMSPATLWLAGPNSDQLELLSAAGPVKTIALKEIRGSLTDRAAVYAINAVREISLVDGKLVEQDYNPQTFEPAASSGTVAMPAAQSTPFLTGLFRVGLTLALIVAIFSSSRRRQELTEADGVSEALVLADLSRRFVAGLIDLFPFVAPLAVMFQIYRESGGDPQAAAMNSAHAQLLTFLSLGAIVVYLIHTAATEALAGRSIGKMIMGLRVVRLDGGTPDASALLTRNFLRVLDVGLAGVPLVFIAFSPLRQRIGDVAAGTVVIRDRVRPEGNLVNPPKETRVEPPTAGE